MGIEHDKALKQFCDNGKISYTDEHFNLELFSGDTSVIYAYSPAHFKRLALAASHYVKEFESAYGEIKTAWPLDIVSPIQPKDLNEKKKKKSK